MSENSDILLIDRDIHFNSFAVILFNEVKPLMEQREQALQEHDYALVQHIEGQIMALFSHRAYDLANHVLRHTSIMSWDVYTKSPMEVIDFALPDCIYWPKHFKRFVSQKTIGFQNNAEGKIAYDIQECVVEWGDGTTETVWRMCNVAVPLTREKSYDFVFVRPRVDIPRNTG